MPGGGQLTASSESPVARPTTGRPMASSTQVSGNSVLSSKSTRGMLQRQKDGQRDAQLCYHSSCNKKKALTHAIFFKVSSADQPQFRTVSWLSESLRNMKKGRLHKRLHNRLDPCCLLCHHIAVEKLKREEGKFFIHEIYSLEQTFEVFLTNLRNPLGFLQEKNKLGGGKLVSQKAVCAALHPTLVSRTEGRRVCCTGLLWHLWSGTPRTSFSSVNLGRAVNETLAVTVF